MKGHRKKQDEFHPFALGILAHFTIQRQAQHVAKLVAELCVPIGIELARKAQEFRSGEPGIDLLSFRYEANRPPLLNAQLKGVHAQRAGSAMARN
jgi:hypothetical protein